MKILLANPRGFCAGVDRAILIVKRVLDKLGPPVYVNHEIVHNKVVLNQLREQGAIFVDSLDAIPPKSVVVFSAHGVSPALVAEAKKRNLSLFDATCPLVSKVHMEVARFSRLGYECILIGHVGHPEVEGTLGYYHNDKGGIYLVSCISEIGKLNIKNPMALGYVTQTTLSLDDTRFLITALKQHFPNIIGPKKEDICYATQNRQEAVKILARFSDVILVIGSKNSSNSNRLQEVAQQMGKPAYLIDSAVEIKKMWMENKKVVGITAGASAPEEVVQSVVKQLCDWGADTISSLEGPTEDIHFPLPLELR